MPEPLQTKTRNLLVALELLAVTVAAILILIDYKLKQDLLKLFAQIEASIENRYYGPYAAHPGRDNPVPDSTVVGNDPPMETSDVHQQGNGNRETGHTANGSTTARRNRRTGNPTVPDPDKPVGTQ